MTRIVFVLFGVLLLVTGAALAETEDSALIRVEEQLLLMPTEKAMSMIKKGIPGVRSYTVLGETTILLGTRSLPAALSKAKLDYEKVPVGENVQVWLLTTKDPGFPELSGPGLHVILRGPGFRVFLADETTKMGLAHLMSDFSRIDPLPKNQVVLTPAIAPDKVRRSTPLNGFLGKLDMETFRRDVFSLADLKTRYTYSQGALQALDSCEKAFRELGLTTRRLPFSGSGTKRDNLEAVQPGTGDPEAGEVLVVGHLDSTSNQASTLAPGADDNGSGAAGVLALARLFKGLAPKSSIRYVLFLGEEQGLVGSKSYAGALDEATVGRIRLVINMDMIGFDAVAPLSILIEAAAADRPVVERLSELARICTTLSHQISYNPWGSDHVPFLKRKIPAVLTIESEFDSNPTYHKTTDVPEKVNFELCREILRLNAAAVVEFAGVPIPEANNARPGR
jgi:hypothetical protein